MIIGLIAFLIDWIFENAEAIICGVLTAIGITILLITFL